MVSHLGPVLTNPFSNENGAVLLRFQKDLRPHLSFSYRFRRPHYNAVSVLKTLLYPRCACSNELDACAFQYIIRHFGYSRCSSLAPGRVDFDDLPFSDSIVFSVYTRKQRFQKASFSNHSNLESVFEWLRFR